MTSSVINFLNGKNIFVFDTETTGLPEKTSKWGTYWDYNLNEKYESARIVSIAWSTLQSFDKNNINVNQIQHHIRYPEGFDSIPTTHIHGISIENAIENGITLGNILFNHGLAKALLNANYIIAHNAKFDYNVLMNELNRIVNTCESISLIMNHIKNLYDTNCIICTGELSTNVCKMEFPNANLYLGNKKNYKMPKLCELYKYFYGCDFENAHSASGDVKALLECLKKL